MPTGVYERRSPEERFWAKVNKTDTCWLWTAGCGGINKQYGTFRSNKVRYYAHRFIYELLVGPIPEGWEVDHLCRVTKCVRPDHLEAVTRDENQRRARVFVNCELCGARIPRPLHKAHERTCQLAVNECGAGHEFTPENTYTWRGIRACRKCHAIYERKRRARQKAEREAAA